MAERKGRIIKPVSVLIYLVAVHLSAKQWQQKLFTHSSCAHCQPSRKDPRSTSVILRIMWSQGGEQKKVIMRTKSSWDMSSVGMTGGRWGEGGGLVDCLTAGNIFICILVSSHHPKRHSAAQPALSLSLQSILILSLHIYYVPPTICVQLK